MESGLYYLQSRYYAPELGRFLNADAFTSTGQGILGNNMFAYCNNNPVNYEDCFGSSPVSLVLGAGAVTAALTGLANGVSSYLSGGEFWPAFGIGVAVGVVSYGVGLATNNLFALVTTRSSASLVSNLLTTQSNNGTLTSMDWVTASVDAVMDGVFSNQLYYYNPVPASTTLGKAASDIFNAFFDGVTDVLETVLFYIPTNRNPAPTRNRPHNYVSVLDMESSF